MEQADFQLLSDLLKKRSGLALTPDKAYLLESRLLPLARSRQMENLSQLCQKLRQNPPEDLLVEMTEAMTTNESSFFRDIKPFELLRKNVLPDLLKALDSQKFMRIWSAACSTGQEPYTISMCLQEDAAKMPGWKYEIVATDLAKKVVDRARQGVYTQFEAQRGLPIQLLLKYFNQMPDTTWQAKDNLRSTVQFKEFNLLGDYGPLGRFDLIFCRNVLIYFDDATKAVITDKMSKLLPKHGVLVLGSTETLIDPQGRFMAVPDFRGAYRLKA